MTDQDERIARLSPERRLLWERQLKAAQAARAAAGRIERADRAERLPLSFAQQRLWFLDQFAPNLPTYKSPWVLRIHGALDTARLDAALSAIVARHEILRTRYLVEDGLPYQVIDPVEALSVERIDLRGVPAGERDDVMLARVMDEARRPVDLAAGPASRAIVLTLAGDDHVVMLDMHHISKDGWSSAVLLREVLGLYQGAALPDLAIQYADFAVWQRGRLAGGEWERQLGYWSQRLAGLPVLDFPSDRARPVVRTWAGASLAGSLPASLRADVEALSRQMGVTPLTVWQAGFSLLLSRWSGQSDVVTGSIFSGRTRAELESLIGFFANTLVLRVDTGGGVSFRELVSRVSDVLLGAHDHQDVPFDKIVDALRPERDPGRNPLFQICLAYQDSAGGAAGGKVEAGGLSAEQLPVTLGTSRFDMVMYLSPAGDGTTSAGFEYSTELFDSDRILRFLAQYERLLTAAVAAPDASVESYALLDPAERDALLVEANRTEVDYPSAGSVLPDLIEANVARRPDAVATRSAGIDVSYAALDRRANRLAHHLRGLGVAPDCVVGVMLPRGHDLAAALVGVLKAGGAYLPLDAGHPAERTAYMLDDSGCRLVVTTPSAASTLPPGVTAVSLEDLPADLPDHAPPREAVPPNLAYVIYTSGSTGRPKGVAVTHANAVDFVSGVIDAYDLNSADRFVELTSPLFDVSIFEIFGALCTGATLVLAPAEDLADPGVLAAVLRDERITAAFMTPSVLALVPPTPLPDLRLLLVGGEHIPPGVLDPWRRDGRRIYNIYGPTEITVSCLDHLVTTPTLDESPPVGRPTPNKYAYVLDAHGRPSPVGVPGQLYSGGLGVTRGYLNRPGLTADRYRPDPYAPRPGARMYATGDRVAWGTDGALRFLGRVDDQVKIRGFRIEPGEIAAVLLAHPKVAASHVTARDDGTGARLVAYLVADGEVPSVEELRAYVGGRLPYYMVPAAFVTLDSMPLNTSGKVNRAALPVPGAGRPELGVSFVPPSTDGERRLADLWAGVLGVERVGLGDNFFSLGGNSLQATQLVSRIRAAFGVSLDLRTFFGNPTIAGLVALADTWDGDGGPALSDEETAAMLAELRDLEDDEVAELLAAEEGR